MICDIYIIYLVAADIIEDTPTSVNIQSLSKVRHLR